MGRMFGTDGVRGVANLELTGELAFKIGKYGAYVLCSGKKKSKIIVGKDPRVSSYMLESAVASGIMASGCDVYLLGVVPTPSIPQLIKEYQADAGVMISASHNSYEFNGIKFFGGDGYKLNDEIEDEIEEYVLGKKQIEDSFSFLGRRYHHFESNLYYSNIVKKSIFDYKLDFSGIKVAIDCSNGSNFMVAPTTFRELNADVYVINNWPNGENINKNCGSTHIEQLQKFVVQIGADIGIAFDGDADRMLAVDEKGEVVDGDYLLYIFAKNMKKNNKLNKNTVVGTVMSNLGLEVALKSENISLVKTAVGDRYILEEMRKNNYNIGAEQSGHIIMLDYNKTGDGLLSAVQLLAIMKQNNKTLSELKLGMKKYPQVLKNVIVNNEYKSNFDDDVNLKNIIKDIEDKLCGEGRVLIRASGTEPLIRIMLEGKDKDIIEKYCDEIFEYISKKNKE